MYQFISIEAARVTGEAELLPDVLELGSEGYEGHARGVEVQQRKAVLPLQPEQLCVVGAPEPQRIFSSDEQGASPRAERAHDQGRVPEYAHEASTGYDSKPTLDRPDAARVLEAPGPSALEIWLHEKPGATLVLQTPLNLTRWRRDPACIGPGEKPVVQVPYRCVLLVALPVVGSGVVDISQVEAGCLQAAGYERGAAAVHAEHDDAVR